jgi:hypothetical protein
MQIDVPMDIRVMMLERFPPEIQAGIRKTTTLMGKTIEVYREDSFMHKTYYYIADEWVLLFLYGIRPGVTPFRAFFSGNHDQFEADMVMLKVSLL